MKVAKVFPELRLAVSEDNYIYRYEEIKNASGNEPNAWLCLRSPTFENNLAELYRYKEGNTITIIVVRKAVPGSPRAIIYDNYGKEAEYGMLAGELLLVTRRNPQEVLVNRVKVIPIQEPEKSFDFSAGCGNWISLENVGYKAGVLRLAKEYYTFDKDAEGNYSVRRLSKGEAETQMKCAKPTDGEAGWVLGQLVDEF